MHTPIYIIFNAKTDVPMFFTDDKELASTFPLYKEVILEQYGISRDDFNLNRYRWEGDAETGKLVDTFIQQKAVVTEEDVDGKYRELLLRKYPLDKMLCRILLNMPETVDEEFNDIKKFVHLLEQRKQHEIETYKSSPVHKWESWDDILTREKHVFKV